MGRLLKTGILGTIYPLLLGIGITRYPEKVAAVAEQGTRGNGISVEEVQSGGLWLGLLVNIIPVVLLIAVFWFFMARQFLVKKKENESLH